MMYVYIVILLSIILLSLIYQNESFKNYSNAIYAIRPPYDLAKEYNPEKLNPYKILKSNFLPYPMEGFTNPLNYFFQKSDDSMEMETGLSKMAGDSEDTKTAIFIDNQFNEMKDIKYPTMTDDEKYTREMVKSLGKRESPLINMHLQSSSSINPEKTDFEKINKDYKFFSSKDCGDGYSFTGAYFSNPNGLMCNGNGEIYQTAKIVPRISGGRVIGIEVIDGGSGYNNPQLHIISNDKTGTGAKAKITAMGDNNSIRYIEIIDGGIGYQEVPIVKIINSVENNSCYLCEK